MNLARIFLISIFIAGGVAAQTSTALPDGSGKALVVQYCAGACHEIQRIEEAQGTRAEWVTRLRRMIRRGAVIPPETMESLADYLADALPPRVRAQAANASPITTTLGEAAIRPIQTWVRGAGALQPDGQTIVATMPSTDASLVKVGQRVRVFALGSRSSMQQAHVSRVVSNKSNAEITIHLAAVARRDKYLFEIIAEQDSVLSIPNEAIIEEGERQVVYVPSKSGDFQPRTIAIGTQGELYTQVKEGLEAGDQVVTFGSFFIDAEFKMKSASKTSAGETNSVAIDYRATPDPPVHGDNQLQVIVKQTNGAPVVDATVTVTYYMPAMASMNMPEMRDEFPLAHQGNGTYRGAARLSMEGTWFVTITVSQGDKPVGKKTFTVIAK